MPCGRRRRKRLISAKQINKIFGADPYAGVIATIYYKLAPKGQLTTIFS